MGLFIQRERKIRTGSRQRSFQNNLKKQDIQYNFVKMSIIPSKKINWNDYSDDDSSIEESQTSFQLSNPEIAKLNTIDPNYKYVWVYVKASNVDEGSRKELEELRYKEKNYAVYKNQETNGYDIKVDRNYAVKLFTEGLKNIKNIYIALHNKNFKDKHTRSRNNLQKNRQKRFKDYRSENKKLNQVTSKQKIKYIDKQTGEEPKNKQFLQIKDLQQKQRKYSKRQAENVGKQLGIFRSKPSKNVQIENQHLKAQPVHENEQVQKLRYIKSAPKITWVAKKNSMKDLDNTEEETKDKNIKKDKKKWIQKEEKEKVKENKKKYMQKVTRDFKDDVGERIFGIRRD